VGKFLLLLYFVGERRDNMKDPGRAGKADPGNVGVIDPGGGIGN
jgi:hypothetical protein